MTDYDSTGKPTNTKNSLTDILQAITPVIEEAGKAILTLQQNGFTSHKKANHDIVTSADLLANQILKSHLKSSYPGYEWVSEECLDGRERFYCDRIWIVDPIDGTKEFASGIPEFAISVALIEFYQPILGVVFNPATQEFFCAVKGSGAFLNGEPIFCRTNSENKLTILASRSEYLRGEWRRFEAQHTVKVVGSIAYKLALVAAGRADATFSLTRKNEWDLAAGALIIQEAGGIFCDKSQMPIQFNQINFLVNGVIGAAPLAYPTICALI